MPTYEYGCRACGHQWELEQRISADPIKECPKCGKHEAQRLISGGNFILKGSGWYADLYHKPASSGKSTESGGDASKGESSGSSSSGSGSGSGGSGSSGSGSGSGSSAGGSGSGSSGSGSSGSGSSGSGSSGTGSKGTKSKGADA